MSRSARISLFVLAWIALFHYETLRLNYVSPWVLRLRSGWAPQEAGAPFGRELPKLKFLYPPAGWIMFFHVDRSYGLAEVYGLRPGGDMYRRYVSPEELSRVSPELELIDPHEIFATRAVWYDNIRRNVLISVLSQRDVVPFCGFLARKFSQYESFAVAYTVYPDVVGHSGEKYTQLAYRCPSRVASDE